MDVLPRGIHLLIICLNGGCKLVNLFLVILFLLFFNLLDFFFVLLVKFLQFLLSFPFESAIIWLEFLFKLLSKLCPFLRSRLLFLGLFFLLLLGRLLGSDDLRLWLLYRLLENRLDLFLLLRFFRSSGQFLFLWLLGCLLWCRLLLLRLLLLRRLLLLWLLLLSDLGFFWLLLRLRRIAGSLNFVLNRLHHVLSSPHICLSLLGFLR